MNTTTVHRHGVVLTALTTAATAVCGGQRQRRDAPARHTSSEGPGADSREDVAHAGSWDGHDITEAVHPTLAHCPHRIDGRMWGPQV
ncbi:hypothetical protein [Streptomyces sp. NPDC059781]|uniref:hypothetical protein n=1 Tax=Streptomyces sp. NPDC059781 TaxID=3346943 RepID=UPI003647A2B3